MTPDTPPPVVVIGAGLAGLAATLALAEAGVPVTLLERRAIPGGRASSFVAQESEEPVDNCQHVLMGCCVNLIDFYRRAGVEDRIRWTRRIHFLDRQGRVATLAAAPLPAPLHLLPSFLRLPFLTAVEKVAIVRALLRMLLAPADEGTGRTAAEWLRAADQPPGAVARFWRPILVSALNEEPERCAATYALQVFRQGFLAHPRAYEIGIPAVPLAELYDPCVRRIVALGGSVRFRARAAAIEITPRGAIAGVRLADGERLPASVVIAAVPFDQLGELIPESVRALPCFRACRELDVSPIAAVHLWFDRAVTDLDHAALIDRPIHWIFNKGKHYGRPASEGSHLGLVVSAGRDWLPLCRGEILAVAEREVRAALPGAREARIVRAAVIKEARATFSATPAAEALRPPSETPVRGLLLAGDWVRTGWPPTMEGAVRSGYRCAEHVLAALRRPRSLLVPDLPWQAIVGRRWPASSDAQAIRWRFDKA